MGDKVKFTWILIIILFFQFILVVIEGYATIDNTERNSLLNNVFDVNSAIYEHLTGKEYIPNHK